MEFVIGSALLLVAMIGADTAARRCTFRGLGDYLWGTLDVFRDELVAGAWIVSLVSLAAFLLIPLPEQVSMKASFFSNARALFWETMKSFATPKVTSYEPELLVRRSTASVFQKCKVTS